MTWRRRNVTAQALQPPRFDAAAPPSVDWSFLPAGRSSNGRTADSDSAYRGSNPCLPATSHFRTTTYRRRVATANPCLGPPSRSVTSTSAAPDDLHPRFRYDSLSIADRVGANRERNPEWRYRES